jgi:carbon-monoxide dehydrogenase medium subunit
VKPAPFDYEAPRDIASALDLLSEADNAKVIAGGQSLGPMLNMRLAQPALLVDIRRIPELTETGARDGYVFFGSCITHAAIEDGKVPDVTQGLMRNTAAHIAYRAVRNRGTIGGSVCHADPAADWVSVLTLLGAIAVIEGPSGRRAVPMEEFIVGTFATVLEDNELLVGLEIPKLSTAARWGHYKFCRKPGEFAEAIGGVLNDPERRVCRAVIGAAHGTSHLIENANFLVDRFDSDGALAAVAAAGLGDDPYERQIHYVALERAARQLAAKS